MLKYLVNLYVGSKVIEGGLNKIKAEGNMGEEFESEFNVNNDQMKAAGYFEAIGSIFLFLSFFGKTFTRIGVFMINAVLGVAIFKHLKAGHGCEGSKNALQLFGLNTLSFLETFRK
ncbi:MAG: hypothetical protein ACTH14_01385 [Jeotgalicoccus sp.]